MVGGCAVLFVAHDICDGFLVDTALQADRREGMAGRVGHDMRDLVFVDRFVVYTISPIADIYLSPFGRRIQIFAGSLQEAFDDLADGERSGAISALAVSFSFGGFTAVCVKHGRCLI